jgi:hypothetical protein
MGESPQEPVLGVVDSFNLPSKVQGCHLIGGGGRPYRTASGFQSRYMPTMMENTNMTLKVQPLTFSEVHHLQV